MPPLVGGAQSGNIFEGLVQGETLVVNYYRLFGTNKLWVQVWFPGSGGPGESFIEFERAVGRVG